jgi:hypothetical protein
MTELLEASFSSVTIIPTAFLVFVLLYWVAVIFGLLDLDFLDIELEKDVSADGVSSVAWLNNVFAFFNLGKVPFMIFLTFLVLPFWALSILANYYLNNDSALLGIAYLLPAFIGALFISKFLTIPFVKIFAAMEIEHESTASIIGQVCTVLLPASTAELGQASVKTKGAPLLLNVKTTAGFNLNKGEMGLVVEYNTENNYYLIEPYNTL